jgi:hypothetical protein
MDRFLIEGNSTRDKSVSSVHSARAESSTSVRQRRENARSMPQIANKARSESRPETRSARARVYLARVIRRTKRSGAGRNFRKLKRVIIARGQRVLSRVNARERDSDFTGP